MGAKQNSRLGTYDNIHTFNSYLLEAKLILLNYSTILTEPEVNNCFSIFTRSDLNRIGKETMKKQLVWLTGEFMQEHEAVNSGCAKVRSLNIFKHSKWRFWSFCTEFCKHQRFKRKRWKFKLLPNSEKKSRALFVSVNSPWMRKFFLSLLANAVNSGYDQGEHCLSPMFFALLTFWHVQFSEIFTSLFSP